ncbi:glycosyltransferase family 4 protein [Humidesulfovibrio sp.]
MNAAPATIACGRPRRVALVISSLALGGAEKTLCVLAGGLARRGREVHVLSFDTPQATAFFPLDPRVRLHGLDLNQPSASALHALRANARRVAVLRRQLRQLRPDAVVGFMDSTNVLCLLACLGLGIPVLATEHTDPRRHDIGVFWNALRRLTYPLAAAVTTQTEAVRQLLPGRCVLVVNPVEQPVEPPPHPAQTKAPAGATLPEGKLLLALGRLAPEKGFDLLLEAFAALAGSRPQWSLVILGEGPERQRLEAERSALGLEGRVLLPGAAAEPAAWLRRAELFALPSRFEGFSNALCEALACGVPAVAFDCQSGPAEILRHGVDGLLVPPGDTAALAAALGRLMDDEPLRRAMAARAPEVLERFGLEKVLDQWEALLAEAQELNPAPGGARTAGLHLLSRLWRMLRTSGPAPDGPRSLRLLETDGRLKTFLLRFLRVRVSPDALLRLRGLCAPLDERARLFRSAISLLNVNETYKTTGSDRTKLADEMLLGLIPALGCSTDQVTDQATSQTTGQSPGPLRLLDIGVSDGSASVALLARLPKGSEALLTDLHPVLYARGPAGFRLFLDARQRLLGVKVLGLYLNLSVSLHANALNFETIDTINPLLQERLGIAAIRPFNALADALPKPVQLIKCANVLNRGYFADAALLAAARNLARSLADGGFLVISQNNAAYPGGEASFALQKRGARLLLAAQANGHLALPLFEAGVELCGQPDCGQPNCEQGNSQLDHSGQPRSDQSSSDQSCSVQGAAKRNHSRRNNSEQSDSGQDGSQRDGSEQDDSGQNDSGQGAQTPQRGGPCAS